MTKRKFLNVARYEQVVSIGDDGEILDVTCTCHWGSLYPNNYRSGDQVCRHIKEAIIKNFKDKEVIA